MSPVSTETSGQIENPADLADVIRTMAAESADPYERDYFAYHRPRYEFTLQAVNRLAAGRRLSIVDAGAYPPYMLNALGRMGHQVFGVVSHHEPVPLPNTAELDLETEPLPWLDDQFDLVLFCEVLEHLAQSPVPALQELLRVTRPGGQMLLTTPNLASARQRLRLLAGRSVMYPLDAYFENAGRGNVIHHRHNREYTSAELADVLSRTGWKVDEVNVFMAYADSWRARAAGKGGLVARLGANVIIGLHRLPGAGDSLIAVASKPAG